MVTRLLKILDSIAFALVIVAVALVTLASALGVLGVAVFLGHYLAGLVGLAVVVLVGFPLPLSLFNLFRDLIGRPRGVNGWWLAGAMLLSPLVLALSGQWVLAVLVLVAPFLIAALLAVFGLREPEKVEGGQKGRDDPSAMSFVN
jgi:hypothetical protein